MSFASVLPRISLRRTYIIARRDFLGYIKTWGFWLTALGPFLGIIFGILFPLVMSKSEPTRYASILDDTGLHAAGIEQLLTTENDDLLSEALRGVAKYTVPQDDRDAFNKVLDEQGVEAAREFIKKSNPFVAKYFTMPTSKLVFVPPPKETINTLEPYILGSQKITVDSTPQPLSGVLHIFEKDGKTTAEFWSTSPTKNELVKLTERYFSGKAIDA